MNAEELRRLRAEIAAIRPSRYGKISRSNVLDLIDAAVARSNQLQVIERDRLARALAEVEHAAGCTTDQYAVDLASRRGFQFGHPVTAHLTAMLGKADAIIRALDSTTGDPE